jgi:uncharacterized protein (DUF2235 family)
VSVPDAPASVPSVAAPAGDVPPKKKIIICLDGTNDQIGSAEPTNVGKTFEMLKLTDPAHQVAYYDPGVGTLPEATAHGRLARKVSTGCELAFGWGIRAKVAEAYTWLMQHYAFGDDVYVFGFSRGAYTARALIGLLNRPGLLRPGSENLVPYAVRQYATNKALTPARRQGMQQFADAFCWGTEQDQLSPDWHSSEVDAKGRPLHPGWHALPIRYVGIWDTVEATGLLRWGALNWPYTHELFNAQRLRHAVSMDEWRRPYREFLVTNEAVNQPPPGAAPEAAAIQEVWFAGVHTDVGGTYQPDCSLAEITLKWVLDGVVREFELRERDSYSRLFPHLAQAVDPAAFAGEIHKLEWTWKLAGWPRRRPIPEGAQLHATVEARLRDPAVKYQTRLPERHSFVDAGWQQLVPDSELQLT